MEKVAKSANPIMKTIQSLENSAHVKDDIKIFEISVLEKKKSYNKLHHENLLKDDQFEQLQKQLKMLESQCDDFSGQQNSLEMKKHEYKNINTKLEGQDQVKRNVEGTK